MIAAASRADLGGHRRASLARRLRWSLPTAAVGLLPLLSACAYFNGIYNARVELRAGDRLASRGREGEAEVRYSAAAAKAETVLVRHPRSKWRSQALVLAGRAAAHAGDCSAARPRLAAAIRLPSADAAMRDMLTLAVGVCEVREAHPAAALTLLEPLAVSGSPRVRQPAALWAARAAIALGDADRAKAVLGRIDAGAAQWELAQASVAAHQYAAAESLLALRAARGDARPDLAPMLRTLWLAGLRDAVERLVTLYDAAGTSAVDRLALHILTAELQVDAALDDSARVHLLTVRRLAVDSTVDAEAAARLTLLALAPLTRLEDAGAAVRRGSAQAKGAALQRRLEDNLQLVERLAGRSDPSGASLFLAAEVARDSLRARRLAFQLFRRIDQTTQGAVLAPRALSAAASLDADSAPALRARLRERYPRSPWAQALDGASPSEFPAWEASESALRTAWTEVALQFADSLARQRNTGSTNTRKTPARPVKKPAPKKPTKGAIP